MKLTEREKNNLNQTVGKTIKEVKSYSASSIILIFTDGSSLYINSSHIDNEDYMEPDFSKPDSIQKFF